jgi:hypothetical protein
MSTPISSENHPENIIIKRILESYAFQTVTPELRIKISNEIRQATGRDFLVEIIGNKIKVDAEDGRTLLFG